MKDVRLPRGNEIRPGARFEDRGFTVTIHPGKHGDDDLRVELNGRAMSFQTLATLIVALYKAEERYIQRGQGGEYLVVRMASWVHWIRAELGKPLAVPRPGKPLGLLEDEVEDDGA